MAQQQLFLDTMPDSNDTWKEIGGNYENAEQSINEIVDNSISNLLSYHGDTKRIDITLEESNDIDQSIIITIEDSGAGIENAEQALTLGKAGFDSVLNEHGYGLKQALAAANPSNDNWAIYKRNSKDRQNNQVMQIKAPYVIGKQPYKMLSANRWPGHIWGNTYIQVRCDFILFENLVDIEESVRPSLHFDFDQVADRIFEDLGYTYATILENKTIDMNLVLKHANGIKLVQKVTPVKPIWTDMFTFNNDNLHIVINSGHIEKMPDRISFNNKSSNRYYKQTATSSGVEIRINGRAMGNNKFEEIFGIKNHPSFNNLLVQVDIISNNKSDLPKTRTTKNGFRIGDEKLSAIYAYIKKSIQPKQRSLMKPVVVSEQEEKHKLATLLEQKYFENQELELNTEQKITVREVPVFTTILKSNFPKIDILMNKKDEITVIEAKKGEASCKDIYQLKMYCDGYFLDKGKMPDHAILVAKEFPDPLRRLIEYFNKNGSGNYPVFEYKHWNEYMENFEESLIEEKKLKMKT